MFIIFLVIFIFSIQFVILLIKIKNGNQSLKIEKKSSEYLFKFKSSSNQTNYILEAINDKPNLHKYLFYQKKIDPDPIKNLPNFKESANVKICLEQDIEDFLNEKQKIELKDYKYKIFNTKRIVSKIWYQIIFTLLILIFSIIAIEYSF